MTEKMLRKLLREELQEQLQVQLQTHSQQLREELRKEWRQDLAHTEQSLKESLKRELKEELTESLSRSLRQILKQELKQELNQELAVFFGKVTRYFDARFEVLEAKVATKADAARVYGILDEMMAKLGIEESERLALTAEVDRHDQWIALAASKLKIEYSQN